MLASLLEDPRVDFALRSVRQACLVTQGLQQALGGVALTKGDRSPVTVADYAVQALLASRLAETFPGERLVAEEDAALLQGDAAATPQNASSACLPQVVDWVGRFVEGASAESVCRWIDQGRGEPSERFWTLDPLDGTKGFLRGGQYATALAYVSGGRVELGVLGCPRLALASVGGSADGGSLLVALRGAGAWAGRLAADDRWSLVRLEVSPCGDLSQARLLRSHESGHTDASAIARLTTRLGIAGEPVRLDSQAKYALLAAGEAEILVRLLSPDRPGYREKIWDQAAGAILVEEAGGQVTDLTGRTLDFSTGRALEANVGIVATNGRLQRGVLDGLKAIAAAGSGPPGPGQVQHSDRQQAAD